MLFFLLYKAGEQGVTVIGVDPRGADKSCSCCGHVHVAAGNRKRNLFQCQACGFTPHIMSESRPR